MLMLSAVPAEALTAKVGECVDCDDGSMDDNYLWGGAALDTNYGGFTLSFAIGEASALTAKGVYRFDLSSLPAASDVSAVTLGFYCPSVGANGGVNIVAWGVHADNNDWVEGTATGQTADDPTDESCGNWQAYNEVTWAGSIMLGTSGTDFYATSYGTTFAGGTGAETITFNATGIAYVDGKMGVDGAEFLIWTTDVLDDNENSRLETGESTTAAWRPYLEITYEIPAGAAQIL